MLQHGPFVKPEPEEPRIAPLAASGTWQAAGTTVPAQAAAVLPQPKPLVKPEPVDAAHLVSHGLLGVMRRVIDTGNAWVVQPPALQPPSNAPLTKQDSFAAAQGLNAPPRELFKKYESVEEIHYAPEDALKEGLGMVKTIKMNLKSLNVGSKMRQEVWMNEIKKCVQRARVLGYDRGTRGLHCFAAWRVRAPLRR